MTGHKRSFAGWEKKHGRRSGSLDFLKNVLQYNNGALFHPGEKTFVVERESRYGSFFWDVLDTTVREITALLRQEQEGEPRFCADAGGTAEIGSSLAALLDDALQRPEEPLPSFEQVRKTIYSRRAFPFEEHVLYAGLHGIDRLHHVMSLFQLIPDRYKDGSCTLGDIGTGPGVVFRHLMERLHSWKGVALDISEECAKHAGSLIDLYDDIAGRSIVLVADARDLPLRPGGLRLAVASEVIEHVPDPRGLIAQIARALQPGGYLITTVPVNLPADMHLSVFGSDEEILSLFRENGFECLESRKQSFEQYKKDVYEIYVLFRKR